MQPKMMLIPCPQMRFNPHPSRRTGATRGRARVCGGRGCFNPHPSRRTGATVALPALEGEGVAVSILTRPGGRVQLALSSR